MKTHQGPDAIFMKELTNGKIKLQQCGDCGKYIFFPRLVCPHCHGQNLQWMPVSGNGTIYTTTTVRRKKERGGDYNVCMVELDEGVRMMSRVTGVDPENVSIGMGVKAFASEIDGTPAVLCKLAGE